jgi:hypothetical protein
VLVRGLIEIVRLPGKLDSWSAALLARGDWHVGFLMVCNFAQFFSVDSYTILIQSIDIGRIGA